MNLNNVVIGGRLVRDPEKRATPGGTIVASFTVAVNERFKGRDGEAKETTSFIECEVWGATAEAVCEYRRKGDELAVVGKLRQDRWEGKDGKAQSKLLVRADVVQWPAKGRGREDEAGDPRENKEAKNRQQRPEDEADEKGERNDIPF